jgi:DNA polymerase-3 subunit epsilon
MSIESVLAPRLDGTMVHGAGSMRERLARWRGLPEADLQAAPGMARFIVVDVEPTGFDPRVDRVGAIGAVTVENRRIVRGRSFYASLGEPNSAASENGLAPVRAPGDRGEGGDPTQALLAFLEFVGKTPLVTYHAAFVEAMIRKATRAYLGERFRRVWLDLAELAPDLLGNDGHRRSDLDGWLERFGIEAHRRHDAACDALASAQLLLVVLAQAEAAQMRVGQMVRSPDASRWLRRVGGLGCG